jgi:hypothetical protein
MMAEAAVASLHDQLGLPVAEARRRLTAQPGLQALSEKVVRTLGSRQAGSWIDPGDGQLVVNVLDADGARTVQAAGARARIVRHSAADLQRIVHTLDTAHLPAGSSWGVDPAANAVVVDVPAGAAFTAPHVSGDAIVIRRSAASAQTLIGAARPAVKTAIGGRADLYGGLTINRDRPGGFKCTSGFLVRDKAASGGFRFNYLLTAGHCGAPDTDWYRGNSKIGYISNREFGPNDFASIALTNFTDFSTQPWVYTDDMVQAVKGEASVTVTGMVVCSRGASTNYNCGQVLAFNQSFADASGVVVSGMDKTSLCATLGDSGGPAMVTGTSGVLAYGLISGGMTTSTGQCQGVTYVEPVWKALNGVELVTG